MKPTLFIFAFLGLSSFAFSQRVNYPPAPSSVYKPYGQNTTNTGQLKSAVLWQNDFSTSSDWSYSNTSSPTTDWSYETDPEVVSVSGPFQSVTPSNGYVVFLSDTSQGATSDAYVEYVGAQIDLTGESNIRIQFEQQFIDDSNERILEVSQDGITWTPFVISDGLTSTGAKEDNLASINISSAAGNASDLHFRFHFSGAQEGYWAIDDIELRTIDSIDVRAVSIDWGSTGAWGVRMPYYSVVEPQMHPIEFCAQVANDGLLDLDTVIFNASLMPALPFDASDTFSIQSNNQNTICLNSQFTPNYSGIYEVDHSIQTSTSELNTLNNQLPYATFQVVSGNWVTYARDDIFSGVQGGIQGGGVVEYEAGNVFDIFHGDFCNATEVHIHPEAPGGATIEVILYSYDPTDGFIAIDQTFPYTITPADANSGVGLYFANGTYLETGKSYLVTARTYWHDMSDSSELIIATSGKSKPNTSFYRGHPYPDSAAFFHLTETPMVRLIFNPEGLNEYQSNFNLQVAPNPSNESTTLSFELPLSSVANFELVDLSGKLLQQTVPIIFSEGENTFNLKTEDLNNGVYFVKFHSDFGSTAKRIIVKH